MTKIKTAKLIKKSFGYCDNIDCRKCGFKNECDVIPIKKDGSKDLEHYRFRDAKSKLKFAKEYLKANKIYLGEGNK